MRIKVPPRAGLGTTNNEIAKPWGKGFGGLDVWGEAYVVLDLPNDSAAEGVEVAVVLEPPHHLRRRRRPRLGIVHGNGECWVEASIPNFARKDEHGYSA